MNGEQQIRVDGTGNVVVQIVGDRNAVNVGVAHLVLTTYPSRRKPARTELDLLDPFRRTTPLVGREEAMAELWNWLHSERPVAVRAVTGRAGAGKTRLAAELVERLAQEAGAG